MALLPGAAVVNELAEIDARLDRAVMARAVANADLRYAALLLASGEVRDISMRVDAAGEYLVSADELDPWCAIDLLAGQER